MLNFFSRSPTSYLQAIFITPVAGQPMHKMETVEALAGQGLQDDRYAENQGFWKATDACQVTLISETELQQAGKRLNSVQQAELAAGKHRRNLVISGVHSKHLEKQQFRIGSAVFEYDKPRPPCAYLETLTSQGMLKALARRSGVCLKVITSGYLKVGDEIVLMR